MLGDQGGYMLVRIGFIAIALLLTVPALAESIDGRNSLIGMVTDSPDKDKLDKQFTFVDLNKDHPVVVYPSGYDYKMTKVFENEDLIVLQFVADITGSTDTIYIEKKARRFLIVTVGALEGVVESKPLPVETHRGVIR
jgi:hypothetical protein